MFRYSTLLLAGAMLAGASGLAMAQMGTTFDPAQLPAIKGKVAQFLPTPRGDVDGFLLDDGTEVHVAPHLSAQLVFAVHPGDNVTIHGLKAKAVAMVSAASVTNDASNVTVVDAGPPMHHGAQAIEVSGKVRMVLHSPHGAADGVLLDSGAVVHLPPPEAKRLAALLAPGQGIVARGDGQATVFGTAIGARELGPDAAHLTAIAMPHPGGEHPMHGQGGPQGMGGQQGMGMHPGGMMGADGGEPPPPPPPPAQ